MDQIDDERTPETVPPPLADVEAANAAGNAEVVPEQDDDDEAAAPPNAPLQRQEEGIDHRRNADDIMKYEDQDHQIITLEAVPIIAVEIDGPHDETCPHDEIIRQATAEHDDYHEATAVMLPLDIEQTYDNGGQVATAPPEAAAAQYAASVKVFRRRSYLLAAMAVILLAALCIGIGIMIGRDEMQSEINQDTIRDNPHCEDELYMINFCLNSHPVNDMTACRSCVEATVPTLYNDPSQFCASAFYNGTSICEQVEICAKRSFCSFACFGRMVQYMQCRLARPRRDTVYARNESTFTGYGDETCILPCGRDNPLSTFPSMAPSD